MKKFMLKMRAKRQKMKGRKEFKQAAFAYMGFKTIIFVLTYIFLTCQWCEYSHIIRQGIHLFLFSHFIYAGMRICSSILSAICLIRGTAFIVNFFFNTTYLLALPYTDTTLTILKEEGGGSWIFLLNGIFMYAISLMIIRALRVKYRKPSILTETAGSEVELTL